MNKMVMKFKKWWERWLKGAFIGLIIGFLIGLLPLAADQICRNDFFTGDLGDICVNIIELPLIPILVFGRIFGVQGDNSIVLLYLSPIFYALIGVLIYLVLNRKSKEVM